MQSEEYPQHFSDARRWQSWLDVEAALARVQAQAGIIPDWAAQGITEAAKLECLDLDELRQEIRRTMAPVHALALCLAKASGEAGAWVHWGATTQNIIDAGRLLTLRVMQTDLKARLSRVLIQLADLAETHAETAMVGRTNRQHAMPITFGFKVAGWIDELLRVCSQIEECENRLFVLRFGGAIGTYRSLGKDGPNLAERLAKELCLRPALYAGRSQVDPLIEYITRLSMLGVAASRIGSDLYSAMQTEVGEISEDLGHDVVGSSTMPHKVNPKIVVSLNADAARLRAKGAAAFAVTPPAHEGDAVTNRELRVLVQESCLLALEVVTGMSDVLGNITVNSNAMAGHLASSGELTALETVMMHLAPRLGRSAAHDVLHAAAGRMRDTMEPLQKLVLDMSEVADVIDAKTLANLMDPLQNTGQSAEIARQVASDGRACAARLLAGDAGSVSRSEAAKEAFSPQRP